MLKDFVPIVAHYDEASLLTKDGQLVQIIKIKGYSERFKQLALPLDEKLRQLLNKILNKNLVCYNITRRDFTSLVSQEKYCSSLAQINYETWMEKNQFNNCLMNDLYLAIVHRGAKDLYSNFGKSFAKQRFQKEFFKKLEEANQELKTLILTILEELEPYGVNLLSLTRDQEDIASEPLAFIYYLLHLKNKKFDLVKADFSSLLTLDLAVKNNYSDISLESFVAEASNYEGLIEKDDSSEEKEKNQLVVLTLNNLEKLPNSYKDQILSLDSQLLLVESLVLASKEKYLSHIQDFLDFYRVSKQDYGVKLLAELEKSAPVETVTNLIIFNEKPEVLKESLGKMTQLFYDLGINFILEDYHKLSAFLSIIPGNRHLVKRAHYSHLAHSCTFTQVQQKSLGGYQGSPWGKPLTLFKSLDNLPFFFNFKGKNGLGHSMIIGPSSEKNSLLKQWLLSESLKFNGVVINFDSGFDDNFIELLEGKKISGQMSLIEDLEIKTSLALVKLLQNTLHLELNEELEAKLVIWADQVIVALKEKQDLTALLKVIKFNPDLDDSLKKFFTHNSFATKEQEELSGIINITKEEICIEGLLQVAYLKKLDKKLTKENLDPYLININSQGLKLGLELLEDFPELIQRLGEKLVVIVVTSTKEELKLPKIEKILPSFFTKFFLSDKYFDRTFSDLFKLNYVEVNNIKKYNQKDMIFLLKQEEFSLLSSYKILQSFKTW